MKRSTKLIIATVLSVGVVGSVAAYKADGWRRGEHVISHIRSELDLSPEQSQALERLRDEIMAVRESVRAARGEHTGELLSVIEGPLFDQARAIELIEQKTAHIREQAPRVLASVAEFYNGLTPEQQAQVREHVAERARHHHGHRH